MVLLRPVVAVGLDPDPGLGRHSGAGAAAGIEPPLVGEEAIADHGQSLDHALAAV